MEQVKGFSPGWNLKCEVNDPLQGKFFPQNTQLKGFSPVCTLLCLFKLAFWLNFLPHSLQPNGFSPVWHNMCLCKFWLHLNVLPHSAHVTRLRELSCVSGSLYCHESKSGRRSIVRFLLRLKSSVCGLFGVTLTTWAASKSKNATELPQPSSFTSHSTFSHKVEVIEAACLSSTLCRCCIVEERGFSFTTSFSKEAFMSSDFWQWFNIGLVGTSSSSSLTSGGIGAFCSGLWLLSWSAGGIFTLISTGGMHWETSEIQILN